MIVNLSTSIEVNRTPAEAFDFVAANFPLNINEKERLEAPNG